MSERAASPRIERLCGVGAVLFGIGGILSFLFAPIHHGTLSDGGQFYHGLLIDEYGGLIPLYPSLAPAVYTMLVLFCAFGVGIFFHGFRQASDWKFEIAIVSLSMVVVAILMNLWFFGLFLIPGIILALLTSFIAFAVSPARQ